MKILTDLHTHTIASTHAYSTLLENISAASQKGIELIAMTDHSVTTPDSPHEWHFGNQKILPNIINGVTVIKGIEANIVNSLGEIDVTDKMDVDFIIASYHSNFEIKSIDEAIQVYANLVHNTKINLWGHIDRNPFFEESAEEILKIAIKNNKIIEINATSYANDKFREKCKVLILLCQKYKAKVMVNSDAHFATLVGEYSDLIKYLEEINFDEELIANKDREEVLKYINV